MQVKQLPITTGDQSSASAGKPSSGLGGGRSDYWRSINDLEQTPEFEQHLHREFPQAASEFPEGVSRRKWLKLMSASLALSGAAGCRYGPEQFAAFVVRPPSATPGIPKHYATNFQLAGRAVHLLVSNIDGRPIKIEGNPEHPMMRASEPNSLEGKPRYASAGTDVYSQACILNLYDPDRADRVARRGEGGLQASSWEDFMVYATNHFQELVADQGESLAIIMAPSLSPAENMLVKSALERLPKSSVVQYESVDVSGLRQACAQAAGKPAELRLDLNDAMVICCLDSDLLGNDPNMLLYSRQFAKNRDPEPGKMNRLYSVESKYSVTGSTADSRLPIRSSQIGAFLVQLEKRVDELLSGSAASEIAEPDKAFDELGAEERLERMLEAMAQDLVLHKGKGVVSVGVQQPASVHLVALRLNQKLGNIGTTVLLMPERSALEGVESMSLANATEAMQSGKIKTAWVLGDNPVYTAPGDVPLGDALESLEHSIYFAEYEDETAVRCAWSVPLAHPLESWGDVLGLDGSYGLSQPQILPLLNGRSTVEILSLLQGKDVAGEALVRAAASQLIGPSLSERRWKEALHNGFVAGVQASPLEPVGSLEGELPTGTLDLESVENGDIEVVFSVSDVLYDGRFAKNVWLQELPQAITKLVWDNAALVSPATAEKLALKQGEEAVIRKGDRELVLPVFIMPGQAPGTIVAHIGYGRVCRDEAVNSDDEAIVGVDVAPLRTSDSMFFLTGAEVRGTSVQGNLATTQDHFAIDELGLKTIEERTPMLVREASLEQFEDGGAEYIKHLGIHHPALESLWLEPMNFLEEDPTINYQWGMTIDLNKCTGCNSCVVACQSENNISVVGKEQVRRGREMHWIRIDRYFRGDRETPQIVSQPVACVHCETAPCEQVCPVAATVHTEEGINAMAYNRCVGTRYCANNCPYKVRRFNYFNYNTEYGYFYGWQQKSKLEEATRKLQSLVLNPEVTVRGRGVMEKCTYCIQRVQNGKINARTEGRMLEDGEVQSACQTACPTQAIVFGNLKDRESVVAKLSHSPRAYAMLEELNIKPRTRYLARVRNTHPLVKTRAQLEDPHHGHGGGHGDDHAGDAHGVEDHSTEDHAAGAEAH